MEVDEVDDPTGPDDDEISFSESSDSSLSDSDDSLMDVDIDNKPATTTGTPVLDEGTVNVNNVNDNSSISTNKPAKTTDIQPDNEGPTSPAHEELSICRSTVSSAGKNNFAYLFAFKVHFFADIGYLLVI